MKGIIVSIILSVTLTGLATWFLFSFLNPKPDNREISKQVKTLEEENNVLQEENQILNVKLELLQDENIRLVDQLSVLPEENQILNEEPSVTPEPLEVSHYPFPDWEQYFPTPDTTTLEGESVESVRLLLGEPPVKMRSIAFTQEFNREIWIYMTDEEDTTALYLYFKGDFLWQSRLDEFSGIENTGILEFPEFWEN